MEDSAFKYTPSYSEIKISSLSRLRNHSVNIKRSIKNYDNLFEYDSNVFATYSEEATNVKAVIVFSFCNIA